ncbi:MAG: hypothetical protein JWR59_604 [Brevundimonas sp.]|nr:hypothetical protein [Brevundimonas sp.]
MIGTSAGTTIAVCATSTSANTQAALAALTYIDIGKVESLGELGPQGQDVTFAGLSGEEVAHLKGATDNGALTIVCGRDPLDAGQIALRTAAATKLEYAIRITEADGATDADPDTVTWLRGPIMGGRKGVGGANDVTKRTFVVGINAYFEAPSTSSGGGPSLLDNLLIAYAAGAL